MLMRYDDTVKIELTRNDFKKKKQNQSVAWYAWEASLGKERYVRLNELKIRRSVCQICITNSLLPLDKSIHYCMIVKDNGKGHVTR